MYMLAFFGLGPPEIILIIVGVMLLFGGKKIPELMKGLGSGMKEFKKASSIDDHDDYRNEPSRIDHSRADTQRNDRDPVVRESTEREAR